MLTIEDLAERGRQHRRSAKRTQRTWKTREKIYDRPRPAPFDRERVAVIRWNARAYNVRHKTERQHIGPLTRLTLQILDAILDRMNFKTGHCFPSYETIAEDVGCHRDSVYEAIRQLEDAGLMTWVHRFRKIRVTLSDAFQRSVQIWKTIRTSNAYSFTEPKRAAGNSKRPMSENPTGTQIEDILIRSGRLATSLRTGGGRSMGAGSTSIIAT